MDYNHLTVFLTLAEASSFTKAAQSLAQSKSSVSRQLASLEAELGVELFKRTTRTSSLTLEGERLYKRIKPLLHRLDNELTQISGEQSSLSGKIRITASNDIAQTYLAGLISRFSKAYPEISFDLVVTNSFLDLTAEKIDIAFRAGRLSDSSLKQKKLLDTYFIVVASQEYLTSYGEPRSLKELSQHRLISFRSMEKGFFDSTIKARAFLTADSMSVVLSMAIQGDGLAILPDFYCQPYLESGSIKRVLSGWKSASEPVHMLFSVSKNLPKRVRLFIESAFELN